MWDDTFKSSALIVVDAQRGFSEQCPDELPVPGALDIIPTLNRLLMMPWKVVYATQDWHPLTHCSFQPGGPYPIHCVRNSEGAEFLLGLFTDRFHAIWRKGFRQDRDAYSAHLDNPGFCSSLYGYVKNIYLCGICTNICVFETASDFRNAGFGNVFIIEDASASLDLPEDNPYCPAVVRQKAIDAGIKFVKASELLPVL